MAAAESDKELEAAAAATTFAPAEPNDGRVIGDWSTRYDDPIPQRAIRTETVYVFVSLFVYVVSILLVAGLSVWTPWWLDAKGWGALSPFVLSFLGGCLGGTLFAMKWLYHSIARGTWHLDRRLWRLFTPFLSGGAALAVVLLSADSVIPLFGPGIVRSNVGALGVSVFLGYFSDRAFSALERFAEQNIGSPTKSRSAKAKSD